MTTTTVDPIEEVRAELESWDGVESYVGARGELAFRLDRRELGHLHASTAHLPLPRRVRDELIEQGRAVPHPVMPDSGWLQTRIDTPAARADTLELFRTTYERAVAARARR